MAENQEEEYIVLFPFMAQGHIIPFLALAQKIIQRKGFSVVFVSTPLNIKKLKTSSQYSNSLLHFLEIPFDSTQHGLPPNTENTDSLAYGLILKLLESSITLKPAFRNLISNLVYQYNGRKPLCVISDFFFSWSVEISHEHGIFHAIFSGTGGFGQACYNSVWLNLPHRKTKAEDFVLPDFPEASRIHITQMTEFLRDAKGDEPYTVFQQKVIYQSKDADAMLFNTVEELETKGLNYFRQNSGQAAWAIGPILLENRAPMTTILSTADQCKNWLDQKPEHSVLYISFGSQNTISPTQMKQLATALEISGRNFIWVVRPPVGFDINSDFDSETWFPHGFEERAVNSKKGLIIRKWAPQVEILSHKSVSVFMSHCGWNSVLEALTNGVALLGWPLAAEQFYNVKFLEEELSVCVEVCRGKDSEVRHEDITEKIELVMDNKRGRGKKMREKGMEVKKIIEKSIKDEDEFKGTSVKALDELFDSASITRERSTLKSRIE